MPETSPSPGPPEGAGSPGPAPRGGREAAGRRSRRAIGGFGGKRRRNPRSAVIAVLIHVVVAVVLVRTYTFRTAVADFLGFPSPTEERLTFLRTAPPVAPPSEPEPEPAAEPPVQQPPAEVPVADRPSGAPRTPLPAAPMPLPAGAGRDTGSVGAGDGSGGVPPSLIGIRPGGDRRLWGDGRGGLDAGGGAGSAAAEGRPLNQAELDSLIRYALTQAKDSLDSLAVLRAAPLVADWTRTDSEGRKWGLDEKGLRLGKITIPSFLLGLLSQSAQQSLGMMGNPTMMERNRSLRWAQGDIARFSSFGPAEAGFKETVEALAEAKNRERSARQDAILAAQRAAAEREVRKRLSTQRGERADDRGPRRRRP